MAYTFRSQSLVDEEKRRKREQVGQDAHQRALEVFQKKALAAQLKQAAEDQRATQGVKEKAAAKTEKSIEAGREEAKQAAAGVAGGYAGGVVKAGGVISSVVRGIGSLGQTLKSGRWNKPPFCHPDRLVHRQELYLPPRNSRGLPYGGYPRDPMDLYMVPGRSQLKANANIVYQHLMEGTPSDQLEVATGLQPREISEAIAFLQKRGFIQQDEVV